MCMMEIMVRILIKNWINKFMVVRFIFLQETCTTGNNTITPHLHEYPGHDEDLDAGRIIRF
jgi:hypothetical protein